MFPFTTFMNLLWGLFSSCLEAPFLTSLFQYVHYCSVPLWTPSSLFTLAHILLSQVIPDTPPNPCTLLSLQITMSSAKVSAQGDSCLTPVSCLFKNFWVGLEGKIRCRYSCWNRKGLTNNNSGLKALPHLDLHLLEWHGVSLPSACTHVNTFLRCVSAKYTWVDQKA